MCFAAVTGKVSTLSFWVSCFRVVIGKNLFPLGLRVVISKRSGCMLSSPRLELIEKVRNSAAKKMEAASEALLKAREAGEGPVFSDDQNTNLAALCKQKGVDPAEFLAAYTTYVRSALPPKATGPELVAFVEKAVKDCPEPAEIIGLYKKKSGRQPSGELPADKL